VSFLTRWRRADRRTTTDERATVADATEHSSDGVTGERGVATVHQPPSLQSRLSNLLAAGLMSTLAVGFLGWYYIHAVTTRRAAARTTTSASKNAAQGEMTLPPLGRGDPPRASTPSIIERALGPAPEAPPWATGTSRPSTAQRSYNSDSAPSSATKTPAQLALERRLAGPVFASSSSTPAMMPVSTAAESPARALPVADRPTDAADLSTLLRPSVTAAVQAEVLPTQRLLLPQGAFLDCTLETAIDSTLPGMTTCVLATDTFGADGSVVLLERGTKLVGETRGQVQQGAARLFVLWTEARTPTGVIVPLASPGADELGRSGLPGEVDRHFWQRFGSAILISVIDGGVQAAVQSGSRGGGTVIYNPSTTTDVTTEVLKSTIAIPPTLTKANGDRIQVLVARDLDFRSVYELRPAAVAR